MPPFIKLLTPRLCFFLILFIAYFPLIAQNGKWTIESQKRTLNNYKHKAEVLTNQKKESFIGLSRNILSLQYKDSLKQINQRILLANILLTEQTLAQSKSERQSKPELEILLDSLDSQLEENFYHWVEKQDSLNATTSTLQFGMQYNSVITYRGRIFGDGDVGTNIWCNYRIPIGITFLLTGYYWPGAERSWAKTDIGIAYERQLFRNFNLGVGYERWFFNVSDKASRTDINNFTELALSYDFEYFSVSSGTYYMFGTARSWQSDLEISSYLEWFHKLGSDKIFLEPSYKAIFGTQFLSVGYYSTTPPNSENDNFFGIMAHEISAKITYQKRSMQLSPCVYFIHPVNGTVQEPVKNFFYYSLALVFDLKRRR